jgi:hypothetical protein
MAMEQASLSNAAPAGKFFLMLLYA